MKAELRPLDRGADPRESGYAGFEALTGVRTMLHCVESAALATPYFKTEADCALPPPCLLFLISDGEKWHGKLG